MKERSELVQLIRHQMSEKLIGSGQDGIVMEHELRQAVERRVCMDFLHKTNVRRKTMVTPTTTLTPTLTLAPTLTLTLSLTLPLGDERVEEANAAAEGDGAHQPQVPVRHVPCQS